MVPRELNTKGQVNIGSVTKRPWIVFDQAVVCGNKSEVDPRREDRGCH